MRTTVYDIKYNSRICEALNIPPTDPRLLAMLNEAVPRLMSKGLFWGAYGTFDIAVTSKFLTLPAQIETIESIAIALEPIPIRDSFYQFVEAGWGQRDETYPNGTGIKEALHLGNFPVIADVGTPSILNLSCDLPSDAGKPVLLLGYDQNNNWIRTLQSGVYSDGEVVALAQSPAGTNTTKQYSRVVDIQPPSNLDGQWWLFQGTTMLGNYQYWETRPSYKRFLVPFLNIPTTARVIGRRAFVPVRNDTDYPIIGNLAALKLACLAVRAEEFNEWSVSNILWNGGTDKAGNTIIGAKQELDNELQFELGVGRQIAVDIRPMPYVELIEPIV